MGRKNRFIHRGQLSGWDSWQDSCPIDTTHGTTGKQVHRSITITAFCDNLGVVHHGNHASRPRKKNKNKLMPFELLNTSQLNPLEERKCVMFTATWKDLTCGSNVTTRTTQLFGWLFSGRSPSHDHTIQLFYYKCIPFWRGPRIHWWKKAYWFDTRATVSLLGRKSSKESIQCTRHCSFPQFWPNILARNGSGHAIFPGNVSRLHHQTGLPLLCDKYNALNHWRNNKKSMS